MLPGVGRQGDIGEEKHPTPDPEHPEEMRMSDASKSQFFQWHEHCEYLTQANGNDQP